MRALWYSISAVGLAINKKSKQRYSESVMFHLIRDSVRCMRTEHCKARRGHFLSIVLFSQSPYLLFASEETDRLIFNEKTVKKIGGRGMEGYSQYKQKGAFGQVPVALEILKNHSLTQ